MGHRNSRTKKLRIFSITKFYLGGCISVGSFVFAENLAAADMLPINWDQLSHIAVWLPLTRVGISLEFMPNRWPKLVYVNLNKFL